MVIIYVFFFNSSFLHVHVVLLVLWFYLLKFSTSPPLTYDFRFRVPFSTSRVLHFGWITEAIFHKGITSRIFYFTATFYAHIYARESAHWFVNNRSTNSTQLNNNKFCNTVQKNVITIFPIGDKYLFRANDTVTNHRKTNIPNPLFWYANSAGW